MTRHFVLPVLLIPILWFSATSQNLSVKDILSLPVPPADHRIPYGTDPLQFGDLRMPPGSGPHPVAIYVHGGCWLSSYDLDHAASFCSALTREGVATWSLEYRRIGNPGGGWPGTFQDVSRGADHLRELARRFPLDLDRVIVVGHSAGGHLALWLAGRKRISRESVLHAENPLQMTGVVSIAGVADLRKAAAGRLCGNTVVQLVGGSAGDVPERYPLASPVELLPIGIRQVLIHGARDGIVPLEYGMEFEGAARKSGDDAKLIVLEDAGHFEMIAPGTPAFRVVADQVRGLLGLKQVP